MPNSDSANPRDPALRAPPTAQPEVLAHRITFRVAALALLLAMGWGGLSPSVKVALQGLPPMALAGWRFLLGWLVVFIGARWEGADVRMKPHERRPLLWLACLWVTQILAMNFGAQLSVASHQAVLMGTYPIWVAVIAHFAIRNDPLNFVRAFGLFGACVGVVVVYFDRLHGSSVPVGDLLILLSAFLLGCIIVTNKLLTQRMTPYKVLTWQMSLGVPTFLVLSALLEGTSYDLTLPVLFALLYQGIIVAGVCFVAQIHLLRKHPASQLTAFGLTTPLWGVTFSHLLLGDPLSRNLLMGGALVVAGVALANRK
jgi:drug/metabolite transporter (DMT)-like permease